MKYSKTPVLIVLICLFLYFIPCLYAQEIFSPFPSSLRIVPKEGGIQLTWRDSADVFESYVIFRYTEEITEENFSRAETAGQVPPGTATFTDYPGTGKAYYYAVLIRNPDGGFYDLFIPFRNKSIVAVTASRVVTEEDLSAEITDIKAAVSGESIRLSFNTDRKDRALLIYRHTNPIASVDDLLEASRIASVQSDSSSYTDFPIPGIQYYYGVFDSKLVQTGTFTFTPGQNISTVPVKISTSVERPGLSTPQISLRSPPLPNLVIQRGIESGQPLAASLSLITPPRKEITRETRNAITGILTIIKAPALENPLPRVLPQHINGNLEGAAYTLGLIIKEQFLKEEYSAARDSLDNFLSIKRTDEVETAARFYLGQALFMTGEFNKAFYEFLVAEEGYYPESQAWIDSIYRILRSGS